MIIYRNPDKRCKELKMHEHQQLKKIFKRIEFTEIFINEYPKEFDKIFYDNFLDLLA